MSVVELLRQNDPTRSSIRICLRHEEDDVILARALEQHGFITKLSVDLTELITTARTPRQWPELLRVISKRVQLEKVRIWNSGAFAYSDSAMRARPFVLAIQQNSNIRSVDFSLALSGPVLTSFLEQATQIKTFKLERIVEITPQVTREVALALQRNANIESLTFGPFGADFTLPILDSLASSAFLKHLAVSHFPESVCLALQRLAEATTSIRCFELITFLSADEDNNGQFHHICQGLLNSRVVTDIKFNCCTFFYENTTNQLKNLLQSKENLRSLSIINCYFRTSIPQQIQEMLVACLQRESYPLRCLELDGHSRILEPSFLRRDSFNTFLHAVTKSKLERFLIGVISSQQQLESLTNNIPAMKVKAFEVTVVSSLNNRTTKDALLEAVQNNFCLRTVMGKVQSNNSIDHDRADLFGEGEKQRLEFYAERNQLVVEWIENPATVHRDVWPEALTLAERAGPDTLFQSLRALSGSGLGLTRGKRKRKRAAEPA